MKKIWSIAAFLLLFAFNVSAQQGQNIQFFEGTFEEALATATKENKLIFMDAYTTWCGPCRWMSSNTFTDAAVAEFYNDNFINVKMDMERGEGPALARKYRVMAYPTLLFINPEGEIAHKKMGALPADAFLDLGQFAQKKK
ncbi:MAG: hypothetical protein Sapg2KO_31170 [Saprospiraceae bacterium]